MLFDYETLKLIWWVLLGVLLIGFAIMDGHDLGVCSLLPFVGKTDEEKRVIINTVGPHWEGNQVWFIVAGGVIFAAFPLLYATAFSGFYWAMMAALWTLFLRPVSFKYRSLIKDEKWRNAWDAGLVVSAVVPAFIFGVAFGNLFLGVPFSFDERLVTSFGGSFFNLLNPFGILCGLVSIFMLIMQGGTYLSHRTVGEIQDRSILFTLMAAAVFVVLFIIAGFFIMRMDGYVITSELHKGSMINPTSKNVNTEVGAWLNNYRHTPLLWAFPALGVAGAVLAMMLLKLKRTLLAFIASSLSVLGVIMTAGVALFPFLLPSSSQPNASLTLWDSVSSQLTLMIMLYVTVFLLPLVVTYTSWAYKVMSGKVTKAYIKENQKTLY
ncbi:MAG: cytochrome d ubiquinol oxidase subunit II [Moraxella sp.]|nr:cytochrome d ubiquinol oxidase subunit II [Moraxella sp.]